MTTVDQNNLFFNKRNTIKITNCENLIKILTQIHKQNHPAKT